MKHLILNLAILLLGACLPAAAQTSSGSVTIQGLPNITTVNTGSINTTDLIYLYQASQGTPDTNATMTQVRAFMQSGAVLTSGTYSNPAWLTALSWSIISGTPTTVAGYGISDAVTLTGTQTLTNKSIAASEITGTLTIGQLPPLVDALNGQTGSVTLAVTCTGSGTATINASGGTVTINIPVPPTYTLPAATAYSLGGVIVDNSTIVVNGSGVVSVGTITTSQVNGLLAMPGSALVGINDSQTLSNKSIAASEITGLPTFPSGTIVGTTDSQTLTNKSIASSEINSGTLTVGQGGTGTSSFAAYGVICGGSYATNPLQSAGTGTSGQVLTSNGASALPTWQSLASPGVVQFTGSGTASLNTTYIVGGGSTYSGTLVIPNNYAPNSWIHLIDGYGTYYSQGLASSPVTLTLSGNTYLPFQMPNSSTGTSFVCNRNYQDIWLIYIGGSTQAWIISEKHPPTYITATLSSGSVTVTNSFISTSTPPHAEHNATGTTNLGALYLASISSGSATFKSTNTSDNDSITVIIP